MIAVFAALKWRLLRNGLRTRGRVVLAVVAAVGGVIAGIAGFAIAASGRFATTALAEEGAVFGVVSTVFVVWVFGPLISGGADETVDPARLALLPLTRRQLGVGLLTASAVGIGPAVALVALAGLVVGYTHSVAGGVVIALTVPAAFALSLTASRALATLLVGAQRSRRGRDISVVVASLVGVTFWLGTQLLPRLSDGDARRLLDVLRWTPPGFVARTVLDASTGDIAPAVLNLAAVVAMTALLAAGWAGLAERLLVDAGTTRPVRATGRRRHRDGSTRGPTAAAVSKELRYLVRSPSRRSVVAVNLVVGPAIFLLQVLRGGDPSPAVVLATPLACVLLVMGGLNNQLGFDAGAMWIEVAAGGPGRAQLFGRNVSWIPALMGPVVPTALVVAAFSGGWSLVPVALLLTVAASGIPMGVSTVMSVTAPFPVADTASPFGARRSGPGRGCVVGLLGLVSTLAEAVLLVPVAVAVVAAYDAGTAWLYAVLVPIGLYSVAVWAIGLGVAARLLRGHEPELLAKLDVRTLA